MRWRKRKTRKRSKSRLRRDTTFGNLIICVSRTLNLLCFLTRPSAHPTHACLQPHGNAAVPSPRPRGQPPVISMVKIGCPMTRMPPPPHLTCSADIARGRMVSLGLWCHMPGRRDGTMLGWIFRLLILGRSARVVVGISRNIPAIQKVGPWAPLGALVFARYYVPICTYSTRILLDLPLSTNSPTYMIEARKR